MIIINFNFLIKIIILLMYLLFFLTKTRDEKRKMTFYCYIDAKTKQTFVTVLYNFSKVKYLT